MSEDEIQRQLKLHAERLAQAEREAWFMKPIPLEEKEWRLRWDAHLKLVEQSNRRIREHNERRRAARHA